MATEIYRSKTIYLLNGTELYVTPLKIKYLREFMVAFDQVKQSNGEDEVMENLSRCVLVCMRQYAPQIKTQEEMEDILDMQTIYDILEYAADIKIKNDESAPVEEKVKDSEGGSWDELDLAALEAELFLLGTWKDYEDLETSLSMPELSATLTSKRELDYQDKKFMAAMQGVDLDAQNGKQEDPWQKLKTKVFSGGATSDSNDILAHQGITAEQNGFGLGVGLGYERVQAGENPFGKKN